MTEKRADVIVVGGGVGGLCAAILLAAQGMSVALYEACGVLGGKAGSVAVDGIEVDTGPSVLTLPAFFEPVFSAAGMSMSEQLNLTRPEPAFRYLYADGLALDVHHDLERTLNSVRDALGARAADEFRRYSNYAAEIWNIAAPHFVLSEAPDVSSLLFGGLRRMKAVTKIDAFRSLARSIDGQVENPHLRMLLKRYATYNGSDVRRAPATLSCISHVELALGGYGVAGGMRELVHALWRAARRVRVDIRTSTLVREILCNRAGVEGVMLDGGEKVHSSRIVLNADVAALTSGALGDDVARRVGVRAFQAQPSMSAHTGIIRARELSGGARAAHTVVFPADYTAEFRDIFDHGRVPLDPTVYLCAQRACHGRTAWPDSEPVFCMVNAPAVSETQSLTDANAVQERVRNKLNQHGLVHPEDKILWWRTPQELAEQFPGSEGALYGAASNGASAAFRRPPNELTSVRGLYLASGSAHPGGGLPMVAQSGVQAASAILRAEARGSRRRSSEASLHTRTAP